jgi:DNA mismatch endonuclease (patch repair protein)
MAAREKTPAASSPAARATMLANRRRDTGPEIALRSELHRRGLRFRVDHPPVAGLRCRADIVFTRARVAVFIDGCFWHACPEHGNLPSANRDWWRAKLQENTQRDVRNKLALEEAGWRVIRVWEHESLLAAADRVSAALVADGYMSTR